MKTFTRISAFLVAVLMVVSCSVGAMAATYDLNVGSVSVSADSTGQYVTQENGVTNEKDDDVTITSKETETSNTISISSTGGATAEVTIKDVEINTDTGSGIDIASGSNVQVNLEGENSIKSDNDAAIHVSDAELTITGSDADDSLYAYGQGYGAGIGSNKEEGFSGSINITANKVVSYSAYGAGIGAGYSGDFTGSVSITDSAYVDGCCVAGSSAGIGSGYDGDFSGSVTIENSGYVYGGSAMAGSGIGTGDDGNFTSEGSVTITDSKVGADTGYSLNSGYYTGTAIGASDKSEFNGTISVTGDSALVLSDPGYPRFSDPLLGYGYNGSGSGSVELGENVAVSYYDYGDEQRHILPQEELPNVVGGTLTIVGEGGVGEVMEAKPQENTDQFWYRTRDKIRTAGEGATVTVDAGNRTFMPLFVLEALQEHQVTLVIQWNGGDEITLKPDFSGTTEKRYFLLSELVELTK